MEAPLHSSISDFSTGSFWEQKTRMTMGRDTGKSLFQETMVLTTET
jgi:hypothetical protein